MDITLHIYDLVIFFTTIQFKDMKITTLKLFISVAPKIMFSILFFTH